MKSAIQSTWKKRLLPVCAICVLLAAAVLLFTSRKPDDSLELADNATMGILPGVDLEQRQAELQQMLDESMISFSINTSPVFETGGAEGNLMLENPANNAKLLVVEIYIDDTQELIYQSKALPAGSYIENTKLDKLLEPGSYDATAYFKAYREADHSYIGQVGADLTLSILS
ncbi:MAG: hypothetical protein HFG08_03405 [Oscillibacter sp.]|nr:hypothetical protein [Oscillibacter sp.]